MARDERWPSISAALAALTALVACAPARAQGVTTSAVASSSGGGAAVDSALGDETSALAALREVEASPLQRAAAVTASGAGAQSPEQALDPTRLRSPEIVQRITPTLLATAERYRADRRSRRTMRGWYRDAGRFSQRIEQWLRAEGMPADLLWVSAAEWEYGRTTSAWMLDTSPLRITSSTFPLKSTISVHFSPYGIRWARRPSASRPRAESVIRHSKRDA